MLFPQTKKINDLAYALDVIRVQLAEARMVGIAEQLLHLLSVNEKPLKLTLNVTSQEGQNFLPTAQGHVKVLLCSLETQPPVRTAVDWTCLSPEVVGEGQYVLDSEDPQTQQWLALFRQDPESAVGQLARSMDGCFLRVETATHVIDMAAPE